MKEHSGWLFDLVRAGAVTVAFLCVFEVGLRATGTWFTGSFYEQDPVMGFVMRPNVSAWYTIEDDNYIRLNSAGFNDVERSFDKPADTFRIAMMGASEVANVSLPIEESLTQYIETNSNQCAARPKKRVEVLNFGIASYTTAQEYLLMKNVALKYHPDLVLMGYSVEMSTLNNVRKTSVVGPQTPYYEYRDGKLVQDHDSHLATDFNPKAVAVHNLLGELTNRIQLLGLVNWAQINFMRDVQKWRPARRDPNAPPPGALRIWCFLPPPIPEVEEAWHLTEGLLDLMNTTAKEQGAQFWVATLDATIQDSPDLAAREALRKKLGVADLYYSERRVAAISAKHNIPEMMLAPRLADYTAEHHVPIHGFFRTEPNEGHWNVLGNQLAGKLIADEFCKSWAVQASN